MIHVILLVCKKNSSFCVRNTFEFDFPKFNLDLIEIE